MNRTRHRPLRQLVPRLGLAVVLAALGGGCGGSQDVQDRSEAAQFGERRVLWSAGHETGSLSEWSEDLNGGVFATGEADARATTDVAHRGDWSMRLGIHAEQPDNDHAVRVFRWAQPDGSSLPISAGYEVWFYFPQIWSPEQYWNLMQWKTKRPSGEVADGFTINVANRPSGEMYLYLYDNIAGVHRGSAPVNLPVGRWVHVRAEYLFSSSDDGHVQLYQDGRLALDVRGVRTSYESTRADARQWSINSYTNGIEPSSPVIYADDAAILASPLRGAIRGSPPPTVAEELSAGR